MSQRHSQHQFSVRRGKMPLIDVLVGFNALHGYFVVKLYPPCGIASETTNLSNIAAVDRFLRSRGITPHAAVIDALENEWMQSDLNGPGRIHRTIAFYAPVQAVTQ